VDATAIELESLMPAPPALDPATADAPAADAPANGPASRLVLPGTVEWPAADLVRGTQVRALASGAGAALRR
jgi:hypothetical protein